MTTVYVYNNQTLFEDESDAYTPEELQRHYAQHFPELNQATYTVIPAQEPEKEGDEGKPRQVIFAKKVGTKGSEVPGHGCVEREILLISFNRLKQKPLAPWELLRRIEANDTMTLERLMDWGPEIEAGYHEAIRLAQGGERICQALYHLQPAPAPKAPRGF